jgi:hypothetical protein
LQLEELESRTLLSVTITRTSAPVFFTDNKPPAGATPMTSEYASFQVTNTGTAVADAWATIGNFTAASGSPLIGMATNSASQINLGPLGSGATVTAFFYLGETAAGLALGTSGSGVTQSCTVNVLNGSPTGTSLASQNFSFTNTGSNTALQDTIAASANKVTTVVTGPVPDALGGIVTMTVTGHTGTIGSGNVLFFTPASYSDWRADAYQMIGSSVALSGGNTGTFTDTLLIPSASITSSSDTSYTATYQFRAIGTTATPTEVDPTAFISSGTQTKHTDPNTFPTTGTGVPVPSPVNTTTIAKSVTPTTLTTAGQVTYTLTLTNSSASVDVSMDQFVDTMPSSPASVTYVAGSSTYNGSAITDPVSSGQTLTWYGYFTVPHSSSVSLVFKATIPSTHGTYSNSAVAYIGNTQINTTGGVPATASLTEGDLPPTTSDNTVTTTEGSTYTFKASDFPFTDPDNDGEALQSVTITTLPASGSLTLDGSPVSTNQVILASDLSAGKLVFTPAAGPDSPSASFQFTVSDGTLSSSTATESVTVTEAALAFTSGASASFIEGASGAVYTAAASDPGGEALSYSLSNSAGGAFAINSSTGAVTVANAALIDPGTYTITVKAAEADDGSGAVTQSVTLTVGEAALSFTSGSSASFTEGANGAVYTAVANDPGGEALSYSLSNSAGGAFSINSSTGAVTVANAALIDPGTYTITVKAAEADDLSGAVTQSVTLTVTEAALSFSSGASASFTEGASGPVYTAAATDPGGETLAYSLSNSAGGAFAINSSTGAVTVANAALIDPGTYTITVKAVEADDGSGAVTQTVALTVTEAALAFTSGASASFTEGASGPVYTAAATDPGGETLAYSLTNSAGGAFSINSSTGAVTVANAALIDPGTYTITVKAAEADDLSGAVTQSVTLTVTEAALAFSSVVSASFTEGASGPVYTAAATDPGGEALAYSLTNNASGAFAISASTGAVTVANAALIDPGTYTITVKAVEADDGSGAVTQSVTLTVTEAPLTVTSGSSASFTEGASGAVYTAAASDPGGEALSYSLTNNAGGAFAISSSTGAVTVANASLIEPGTYTITVQAAEADDGSGAATQSVTLTVSEASLTAITNTGSGTNTVAEGAPAGTTVGITAHSTDPGGEAVMYTLTVNPGGAFAIDPVTGMVTVANSAALGGLGSSASITVQASEADDGSGAVTKNFTITITPIPPTTGNNTVTMMGDSSYTFKTSDFPFTDPDNDGETLQSVRIDSLPAQGTLTLNGNPVSAGQVIPVGQVGNLQYAPPANRTGSPLANFAFAVSDGVAFSSDALQLLNVTLPPPPAINPLADVTLSSCSTWMLSTSGSFSDPTAGPWTGTVNYGDGSATQALTIGSNKTFNLAHTYLQRGVYQVTVTITDSFNLTSTATFLVSADFHTGLPQAYSQLVTINDGSVQRSMVNSITLTFGDHESLAAGAISLTTAAGQSVPFRTITRDLNGQTVVFIQFTGSNVIAGSLADGRYQLKLNGSLITNNQGVAYNGGGTIISNFWRLFGDAYGTATVNSADLAAFQAAMRSTEGTSPYRWYLDYDQSCTIDSVDYNQFLLRYGHSI